MKITKKSILFVFLLLFSTAIVCSSKAKLAYAVNEPGGGPSGFLPSSIVNPILPDNLTTMPGTTFLGKFLRTGISLVLIAGTVIFFFILTSGGIRWLSSSGDKANLESAQKQISSGLVGLVILLSSFVIIKLIETLFGIDLLNITLPTL